MRQKLWGGQETASVPLLQERSSSLRQHTGENITLKTICGYYLNTPITSDNGGICPGDRNGSSTTINGTGTYWCLDTSDVWNGPETEMTET